MLAAQQLAGGSDQRVELLCRALALWRAALAGAKAGRLGTRRIFMKTDIVAPRSPRRAVRPAIDAGAAYGEDEAAVERLVAFAYGLPALVAIDV